MRKYFFKYLFAGLLVFAYGAGAIGIGQHYCRCEESVQAVLPVVEQHACGQEHSRQEEKSHCCRAEQEAVAGHGDCCTVQVELLQIDQRLPALPKVAPDFYSILLYCYPAAALFASHAPVMAATVPIHPPPLLNIKYPLFLQAQQWRL
ncbi:MAG: hypothetical protein LBN98_00700 [Prevotellaceae bacterium]|jgi:hypothetical protein|nr:hypothetical protein [Prevotellaceae bacterium]